MEHSSPPQKISLAVQAAEIAAPWRPHTVALANGQEFKLARLEGSFVWHCHEDQEEVFLGVEGRFRIDFRGGSVELGPGEMLVIPRGVEHCPAAEDGALVLLVTREGTRNTGNVVDSVYTAP